MQYRFDDILIDDLLEKKDDYIIFDVRSPSEYADDHIIGAINIPILDDEERKRVGIVYKEEGARAARELGKEILFPKLPEVFKAYREVMEDKRDKKLLVYCFRGGDRSKIMSTLLSLDYGKVCRLSGGYKSYRKAVLRYFDEEVPPDFHVLYGGTGTGKTHLLEGLAMEEMPVIDLEGLANHRGSVFGHVGLDSQPSQKYFETTLYNELYHLRHTKGIIVEGESKKIGRLHIPDKVFEHLLGGYHYLVTCEMDVRIKRLIKDYGGTIEANREQIEEALNYLMVRLGKEKLSEIKNYLKEDNLDKFVQLLLSNYYDPLYNKNRENKVYEGYYHSEDLNRCVKDIINDLGGKLYA